LLVKIIWTVKIRYHSEDSGDEKSKIGGEEMEVKREIFTPKETGIKVNLQRQLFLSPAEEYFTPTKHDKNKRKHTFIQGAPARNKKRVENKLMLPFKQSITTGDEMAKALGIRGDEQSNFILVQRPDENGNYSSNKEIQEGKKFRIVQLVLKTCSYRKRNRNHLFRYFGLTISNMYTRNCIAANPKALENRLSQDAIILVKLKLLP
jgi:hypothetical protein